MDYYKPVDFNDEKALQGFLLGHPYAIEDGMQLLKDEVRLRGQSRLDILGQDKDGKLVLIELKAVEAGVDALTQILDYADFAYQNFRLIFDQFQNLIRMSKFDPNQHIRLIVVAPSFSNEFTRLARHIKWEIELVRYIALKSKADKLGITFISEDLPAIQYYPQQESPNMDSHLEYITDDHARKALQNLVSEIENLGDVKIVPTQNYIGAKKNNVHLFVEMYTRRKHTQVWYREYSNTDWKYKGFKLKSPNDLTEEMVSKLRASYEGIGTNNQTTE